MIDLIERLDRGDYSCVVAKGEDVRCFSQRGVADLHQLLSSDAEFLRGSMVADKVVGKGAAALMVSGGVERLYSHVISEGALELFARSNVKVEYGRRVDHIINRAGDGWCPVERLCHDVHGVEEILPLIDKFMTEIQGENRTPLKK